MHATVDATIGPEWPCGNSDTSTAARIMLGGVPIDSSVRNAKTGQGVALDRERPRRTRSASLVREGGSTSFVCGHHALHLRSATFIYHFIKIHYQLGNNSACFGSVT